MAKTRIVLISWQNVVTTNPRPTQGLLQKKNKYLIFTAGHMAKTTIFFISWRNVVTTNPRPTQGL